MPVVLAVNKYDSKLAQDNLHEYWQLGIGEPIGISAEHGLGVGDLLDEMVKDLPVDRDEEQEHDPIRVAIVGRPNVGKSSLLNAHPGGRAHHRVGHARELPGMPSTPTSMFEGTPMTLIDTAGLRRPGKRTTTDVEYYSSLQGSAGAGTEPVALVVVDANEGLVDLDLQVAYEAQRAKCATAILFNKWDVSEIDLDMTVARIKAKVQMRPRWLTVSALTGRGVDRILPLAKELYGQYSARIPTAELNRWLEQLRAQRPAAGKGAKAIKTFYMVQYETVPTALQGHGELASLVTQVVRLLPGEPPA